MNLISIIAKFGSMALYWPPLPFHVHTVCWKPRVGRAHLHTLPGAFMESKAGRANRPSTLIRSNSVWQGGAGWRWVVKWLVVEAGRVGSWSSLYSFANSMYRSGSTETSDDVGWHRDLLTHWIVTGYFCLLSNYEHTIMNMWQKYKKFNGCHDVSLVKQRGDKKSSKCVTSSRTEMFIYNHEKY